MMCSHAPANGVVAVANGWLWHLPRAARRNGCMMAMPVYRWPVKPDKMSAVLLPVRVACVLNEPDRQRQRSLPLAQNCSHSRKVAAAVHALYVPARLQDSPGAHRPARKLWLMSARQAGGHCHARV